MARILLVDDDPTVREMFARFLRDDAHEVTELDDGSAAQGHLDTETYDVAVLDVLLPGMDGLSLTRQLAERAERPEVIVVTGQPTLETAAEALRAGAFDYLPKPVAGPVLRKVVANAAQVRALRSEKRRLEKENRRHREELARLVDQRTRQIQAIFANVPGVIMRVRENEDITAARFEYVGETCQEVFGIEAKDIEPRHLYDLCHAEDRERLRDDWRGAAHSGALRFEGRFILPGGGQRWLQLDGRASAQPDGQRVWDAIVMDVTERRAMQSQLLLVDRMASVGTLAAGMAHEINNPLSYLISNLAVMEEVLEGADATALVSRRSELQDALGDVLEGADRIRRTVTDLRTFSRANEERVRPVDVHSVLDSSIRIARNEIRHRAQLVREYGTIPLVSANASRLGQVFLSLLIHSAQAITEGEASSHQIVVGTEQTSDGQVRVRFHGSGPGIPPEQLSRAFDPFESSRAGGGFGMSLYVCNSIVTALGGEMSAESTEERGTLFSVVLLAAPEEDATASVLAMESPAPEFGARVLIVDDEPLVLKALRRALRGHDVTSASSGREAIRLLEEGRRFDLILCDLMMPDLTGMAVYSAAQAMQDDIEDRIVFVTGGAFTPATRDFLGRIPNRRMDKPFSAEQVRQTVGDAMRAKRGREGAAG